MLFKMKKNVVVTCNFAFGTNTFRILYFLHFFTLQITGIDFDRLSFVVLYFGQPGPHAGQVLFASHLPRDKFCQKYLSDPEL